MLGNIWSKIICTKGFNSPTKKQHRNSAATNTKWYPNSFRRTGDCFANNFGPFCWVRAQYSRLLQFRSNICFGGFWSSFVMARILSLQTKLIGSFCQHYIFWKTVTIWISTRFRRHYWRFHCHADDTQIHVTTKPSSILTEVHSLEACIKAIK